MDEPFTGDSSNGSTGAEREGREGMRMAVVVTDGAPAAVGPYSQAIAAGDFLFVSGQLPVRPGSTDVVDGAIADQTRQALSNALAVVREAGLGLADVAKATIFVTDLAAYGEVNAVYESFFHTWRPARSVVEVSRLPRDAGVEIELIAARHHDDVRRFEGAQ